MSSKKGEKHEVIDDIGEYIAEATDSSVEELEENKIDWCAERAENIKRNDKNNETYSDVLSSKMNDLKRAFSFL